MTLSFKIIFDILAEFEISHLKTKKDALSVQMFFHFSLVVIIVDYFSYIYYDNIFTCFSYCIWSHEMCKSRLKFCEKFV